MTCVCVFQGNLKPDVFGFISRETGSVLICHLLRCCTTDLVCMVPEPVAIFNKFYRCNNGFQSLKFCKIGFAAISSEGP